MNEPISSPEAPRRRHKPSRRTARGATLGLAGLMQHRSSGNILFAAMVVLGLIFTAVQWHLFSRQIGVYGNLWVGMTPAEAQYFEGKPLRTTQLDGGDVVWEFNEPNAMRIHFAQDRAVELACPNMPERSADCPGALGLSIGDGELALYLRLGDPTSSALSNGTKILQYEDIGYTFLLERAEIRGIVVMAPSPSIGGRIVRFCRWLLP